SSAFAMFGHHESAPALRRRLRLATAVGVVCLAAIFTRLWMLQVLYGDEMRTLSEDNRIRLRRTEGTRGLIVDRYGKTLVDSRPSFDAMIVPEDARDMASTVELLAHFLKQTAAQTQSILEQASGRPPFQEILVKRDLDWDEIMAVETHQLDLAGVSLRI